TAWNVVIPSALSGIGAAYILGISRAIGETMIVAVAGGNIPKFTLNPLDEAQTITANIVATAGGEPAHGTIEYQSLFAAGLALFVMTLSFNIAGYLLRRRYHQAYWSMDDIPAIIAYRKRQDWLFSGIGFACMAIGIATL